MIGNIYRSSGHGSNHSRRTLRDPSRDSFKSPFMYSMKDDDSCRTTDLDLNNVSLATATTKAGTDWDYDSDASCSFGEDFTIDTSQASGCVVNEDDDLDEIEKALEVFAAKEEQQRKSNKDHRRRSTGADQKIRQAANAQLTRSKSLDSNQQEQTNKILSNSNRSLLSLCPPKDQLQTVFGSNTDFSNFHWEGYFQELRPDDVGTMTAELERAIQSKKIKRLERLVRKGVSMTARNKQGETVAHLACRSGSPEILMYLIQSCGVSIRVRDSSLKTPLHEVAWNPTFNPSIAMMLMSNSPELLWAPDARGFLALDYVPRRVVSDWYDFLEAKQLMLRLSLRFSRFKASSIELNANQERLKQLLERQLHDYPEKAGEAL